MEAGTPALQKALDERASGKGFGTFQGVFTPTLLTILGVIMFLRTGSVVGNAGLFGAWLIIGLACMITCCTGLSLSTITTNIRIGAGGAYSIISQSLGLEMGGSIGIALYFSQALAVSMYIFGFREGWLSIPMFAGHPALLVDLAGFLVLFAVAFISADLAFRIEYLVMAIICAALVGIFATFWTQELPHTPQLWGTFPGFPETGFSGTGFWVLFALFFPAATGVMAGANMSGELREPRRSIPIGTMAAIALTTVIYLALAYWLACVASPQELVENYGIAIERSLWPPVAVAGLLGATLSSGLASLVGAPRILFALGEHGVLPRSAWFARSTRRGEPRNAMLFTGAIVLLTILLRDLNVIAPLITMFFLITYCMINLVVLMEQSLGLISFRPIFPVPRFVPLFGAAGCLFAMLIIQPVFSIVAVFILIVVFSVLQRRRLRAPFGDMRSGLFVAMADWAAKRVSRLPRQQERAWKPNLLVPVEDIPELRGSYDFLSCLVLARGSLKLLGLPGSEGVEDMRRELPVMADVFRKRGIFTSWAVVEEVEYDRGILSGIQILKGAFFHPNVLFLSMPSAQDSKREGELRRVLDQARRERVGILIFADHPRARMGRRDTLHVWVRDQSPDWLLSMQLGNIDMALLIGFILRRHWQGSLRVITVVRDAAHRKVAGQFLRQLVDLARMPRAEVVVEVGDFREVIARIEPADLDIIGMPNDLDFDFARSMVKLSRSACLFVRDSGDENALA